VCHVGAHGDARTLIQHGRVETQVRGGSCRTELAAGGRRVLWFWLTYGNQNQGNRVGVIVQGLGEAWASCAAAKAPAPLCCSARGPRFPQPYRLAEG